MTDSVALLARRRLNWCQTPETRLPDPDAAARFIQRVGIATLYPVSPEIPNLFHAYVGDPEAQTDSKWDSPSGHVYTWRWELGKREAAFYSAVVRKKPTWVSWPLLPAVLRLFGDLRLPEELYAAGELSPAAFRIAEALAEAGGVRSTGELRRLAGFPTGKDQRAAYLRAIEQLDAKLLLAKVFSADEGETDMSHALVRLRYPDALAAAEGLTREDALDAFLGTYLPAAVFVDTRTLGKHLRLPESELKAGLERLGRLG